MIAAPYLPARVFHLIALGVLAIEPPHADAAQANASTCGTGQLSVPMTRERTGHVSVKLKINGVDARVLVDTGANVNTLDIGEGRKLNPTLPAEGRTTMTVALGSRVLGPQEFSVHDLNFINIPSQRHGTEPFAGQLGAQFFTDYKATIDFAGMVLCVSPSLP